LGGLVGRVPVDGRLWVGGVETRAHRDELDGAGRVRVRRGRAAVGTQEPALWGLCGQRNDGEQRKHRKTHATLHGYLLDERRRTHNPTDYFSATMSNSTFNSSFTFTVPPAMLIGSIPKSR